MDEFTEESVDVEKVMKSLTSVIDGKANPLVLRKGRIRSEDLEFFGMAMEEGEKMAEGIDGNNGRLAKRRCIGDEGKTKSLKICRKDIDGPLKKFQQTQTSPPKDFTSPPLGSNPQNLTSNPRIRASSFQVTKPQEHQKLSNRYITFEDIDGFCPSHPHTKPSSFDITFGL